MSARPVEAPHLPRGQVELLAIGEGYRKKLEKPLISMGSEVLWLPRNPNIDPRLASHADLSMLHLGKNRLIWAMEESSIVNYLTTRGFICNSAKVMQMPNYPLDCGLCGCLIGNSFIHNIKYTDKAVLDGLTDGTELIHVRQGYAKCAVCVVDERGVITSDAGIAKEAAAHGIDALLIRQGFIELAGFDTGFIGGASFKLSRDKLAFTGTLNGHPDRDAILTFLRDRCVEPIYLTQEPIFDIGSAIPLSER